MNARIEKLLAELTLDEKAAMVAGVDLWHTAAVPTARHPGAEGDRRARAARAASGGRGGRRRSFPCGTALGATWNPELVRDGRQAHRRRGAAQAARTCCSHRPSTSTAIRSRAATSSATPKTRSSRRGMAVGVHHRRAVDGRRLHGEALRRQRLRVRAHDDQLRGRRAHAARDLARPVRGRGARSGHVVVDDRVQPRATARTAASTPLLIELLRERVGLRRRWSCRTGTARTAPCPPPTPASTSRCPGPRSSSARTSRPRCARARSSESGARRQGAAHAARCSSAPAGSTRPTPGPSSRSTIPIDRAVVAPGRGRELRAAAEPRRGAAARRARARPSSRCSR